MCQSGHDEPTRKGYDESQLSSEYRSRVRKRATRTCKILARTVLSVPKAVVGNLTAITRKVAPNVLPIAVGVTRSPSAGPIAASGPAVTTKGTTFPGPFRGCHATDAHLGLIKFEG